MLSKNVDEECHTLMPKKTYTEEEGTYPLPMELLARLETRRQRESVSSETWEIAKIIYDLSRDFEAKHPLIMTPDSRGRYPYAPQLRRDLTALLIDNLTDQQLDYLVGPSEVSVLLSSKFGVAMRPYLLDQQRHGKNVPAMKVVGVTHLYSVRSVLEKEVRLWRPKPE
jgi:hypothetical protein